MTRKQSIKTFFLDKVFPVVLSSAVAAFFTLVTMYFTQLSQGSRIAALEEDSVRKDVLTEVLTPMKDDIREMKSDIKDLIKNK